MFSKIEEWILGTVEGKSSMYWGKESCIYWGNKAAKRQGIPGGFPYFPE